MNRRSLFNVIFLAVPGLRDIRITVDHGSRCRVNNGIRMSVLYKRNHIHMFHTFVTVYTQYSNIPNPVSCLFTALETEPLAISSAQTSLPRAEDI